MSYPPPGYPQYYGQPQPGYGPQYYRAPSPALGYVVAVAFLLLAVWTVIPAFLAAGDGSSDSPHLDVSMIGMAFAEDITGNADFGIAASFTAGFTVLLFALVMFARLEFMRWVLAVLGGIITCYYIYAVIYIAANGGGEFIWLPLVCLILWMAATVITVLPATGAAMRRRQNQWG